MGAGRDLAIVAAFVVFATAPALAWDAQVVGTGPGRGVAKSLATAANGDVIASGLLYEGADGIRYVVVRLNGATGAERWRRLVPDTGPALPLSGFEPSTFLAIDEADDVLMAAPNLTSGYSLLVKLSGETGALVWRHDFIEGAPIGIVTDIANDVYVATSVFNVVKTVGATGSPTWALAYGGVTWAAMDKLASGDPIIVGRVPTGLLPPAATSVGAVLRLDRMTGGPVWTQKLGTELGLPTAVSVAGDVVYVGTRGAESTYGARSPGVALALSAETGAISWSRPFPFPSFDPVTQIATTSAGDAAILGVEYEWNGFPVAIALHAFVLARPDGSVLADAVVEATPDRPCMGCAMPVGTAMVPDASGHVSVVGSFRTFELVVSRRDAADLHEIWRRDGGSAAAVPGIFLPAAAAAGTNGSVIVAGGRRPDDFADDKFTVFTLDAAAGAIQACGDGAVDSGEACDDGNVQGNDCCGADCKAAASDGTTCDDHTVCTTDDTCLGGTCTGGEPLPCEPCGQCDSVSGCFVVPSDGCGQSTITNGSQITIARPRGGSDRFAWSLRSGPATAKSDFGNPLDGTGYALCASLPDGKVVVRAVAPAGKCSRRRPCWRSTRAGFEYADPGAPEGLAHLSLRAGAAGKSKWSAGGAHAILLSPLPLTDELHVELRRLDDPATCWSATLPKVTKNSARKFRAKGR